MIVQYNIKSNEDESFTYGKAYIVIGVGFRDNELRLRVLIDKLNYPAVERIESFEIIDNNFSDSFKITQFDPKIYSPGVYYIEPKEFNDDFWEKFYDGDDEAEELFRKVLKRLYDFHGWRFDPRNFQYK